MSNVKMTITKIEKNDIIIIKDPDCQLNFSGFEALAKIHSDNIVVYLTGNTTLQTINEDEMNRAGWFKKENQ